MSTFKNIMAKIFVDIIIILSVLVGVIAFCIDKSHASEVWTKNTYSLHTKLVNLGMDKNLAKYVINRCKETADNPRRCVTTAAMISKAESQMGQNAYKNNVWGINEGKTYKSVYENFDRWLKSYNKYWYKSPLPAHYYPPKGGVSKTMYCTDEHSSGSKKGCPNGLKHATVVYNILNK